MKTIPKIDRVRLGQLLPGALLKLGSQIVTFDGCRVALDYQHRPTRFVEYTGPDGCQRRFDESVVLQSATEDLDAEACAFCGKFRAPEDRRVVNVQMYRRTERHIFCVEGGCAEAYQATIKRPPVRTARQNVRRSPWGV
ncbi:TPA: hypothetical protein ACSTLS_000724 [Serratia fonticola]